MTMKVDLVLDGLTKARDFLYFLTFLTETGYFKYEIGKKRFDYPCCIYGAVTFATNQHPVTFAFGTLGRKIIEILKSCIPTHLMHRSGTRGLSLIEYSDRVATTQEDVVALFNRAIDKRAER